MTLYLLLYLFGAEAFISYIFCNNRFGFYRSITGSRYTLSIHDIAEAEKKVRIRHLLKAFPNDDDIFRLAKRDPRRPEVDTTPFLECVSNADQISIDREEDSVIVYVAGIGQRIADACDNPECCFKGCVLEENTEYIDRNNRGGLTIPVVDISDSLRYMTTLLKSIVATECLRFHRETDQKQKALLVELGMWPLSDRFGSKLCPCAWQIASMFANTLLDGYTKQLKERLEKKQVEKKTQRSNKKKVAKHGSK